MKEKRIGILDEEGERLCLLLQKFGYGAKESKIVVFMLENSEGISRDIEQATGLRQPETSVGLRKLEKSNHMKRETIETSKKGRPVFKYKFNLSISKFKKILQDMVEIEYAARKKDLKETFDILDGLEGKHVEKTE